MSLNNNPCMTRMNLIELNSDEWNQGLSYYPFMANLDNAIGVVILLMIHPVEYVFQTKHTM